MIIINIDRVPKKVFIYIFFIKTILFYKKKKDILWIVEESFSLFKSEDVSEDPLDPIKLMKVAVSLDQKPWRKPLDKNLIE